MVRNLSSVPSRWSGCCVFPDRISALLQPYKQAFICMRRALQTFGGSPGTWRSCHIHPRVPSRERVHQHTADLEPNV